MSFDHMTFFKQLTLAFNTETAAFFDRLPGRLPELHKEVQADALLPRKMIDFAAGFLGDTTYGPNALKTVTCALDLVKQGPSYERDLLFTTAHSYAQKSGDSAAIDAISALIANTYTPAHYRAVVEARAFFAALSRDTIALPTLPEAKRPTHAAILAYRPLPDVKPPRI